MDDETTNELLGDAERISWAAFNLNHRLDAAGDFLSADEARVIHMGANAVAKKMAEALGVEPNLP